MISLIFTYVMAYGGASVSLFNPFVGVLIYVCFAILKPDVLWGYSVPQGNYSRIIGIALLIGWVVKGCGSWKLGKAWSLVALLLAFLGWSAVCAAVAPDSQSAFRWVEDLIKIVLPFLVAITTIDSVGKLKALVWVSVLSQGFVAYEMNLMYFKGDYNPIETSFCGMDNNCMGIALDTCIALAFFLGLHTRSWALKALLFVLALLMAHAILFSMSRGGMLGLIVTGAVSFLVLPKRPVYFIVMLVGIAIMLRLAGPQVQERFFSTFADQEQRDGSAEGRRVMWGICIQLMYDNPVVGIGPNHFPLTAHHYGLTRNKQAHTLWLQLGAEMGVVGVSLLGTFYLLCAVRLYPLVFETNCPGDPWLQTLARMVVASLCGFVVAAQFVSLIGLEVPYYLVLVGAGILKLTSNPEVFAVEDEQAGHPEPAPAWSNA